MTQAPHWKKDAVPSTKGWHDPKTGELLKSTVITQAQVDEYLGVKEKVDPPTLTEVVHYRQEDLPKEGEFVTEQEQEQKTPGFFDKVTNLLG